MDDSGASIVGISQWVGKVKMINVLQDDLIAVG